MFHVARRVCFMLRGAMNDITYVACEGWMIGRRGFEEECVGAVIRGARCISGGFYLVGVYTVDVLVGDDRS